MRRYRLASDRGMWWMMDSIREQAGRDEWAEFDRIDLQPV